MPGRRTARSADKQRRGPPCAASAAQTGLEQRLALLGALAALALRAAEELCELVVAVALRIGPVLLHPQCVAQALLGEPDEVVVLVLRAGDLATLGRHRCLLDRYTVRLSPTRSPSGDAGLPTPGQKHDGSGASGVFAVPALEPEEVALPPVASLLLIDE